MFVFLEGLIFELELFLFFLGLDFEFLVLLLRVLGILDTEEVSLLQIVKELDHFMGLTEVHILVIEYVL